MFRALALTFALGLTPAFAEDIAAPILDGLPTCDGTCPEPTVTAMSSDLDGDGEAEYFDVEDSEGELAVAEANCGSDLPTKTATCAMPIDALSSEGATQL